MPTFKVTCEAVVHYIEVREVEAEDWAAAIEEVESTMEFSPDNQVTIDWMDSEAEEVKSEPAKKN